MKKFTNIKAIIFDYDGTIADTESVSFKLYPIIFKKLGYDLSPEQALQLRSAGYPLRLDLARDWYGVRHPKHIIKKIAKMMYKAMDDYKKDHPLKLRPYVKETLKQLSKLNIPVIIASSTIKSRIEDQLNAFGIRKYFNEIYSTESVKYGKPFPDIYWYVCKQLNLNPEECLAVEDCPNGVISAASAGCQTVMVPDLTLPDKELKKKYKFTTIKSLKELLKLLKKEEN